MINALKYVEVLEKSGFTEEEAKTSLNIWLELMNDNLASKMDLRELEIATKQEFAAVRTEMSNFRHEMKEEFTNVRHEMKEMELTLRSDIHSLEHKLTIKLGLMMAAGLTLMGLIQKL